MPLLFVFRAQKIFFLLFTFQSLCATPLREEFKERGYVEICSQEQSAATFETLYAYFDEFIGFLQTNPIWMQKLTIAKERFLRTKERNFYSTDFFGFYDESGRISFYYSTHFHEFIVSHYPELNQVPEIIGFFEACLKAQKSHESLFSEIGDELGLSNLSVLFKVIKYLPSYKAKRPHYDGTAFSFFLDSTDNEAILLSPYKSSYTVDDFSSPTRELNSILLIPGAHLTEFSIYPTPHIVAQSGKTRYATIAFAMRPDYTPQKIEFPPLPNFKY